MAGHEVASRLVAAWRRAWNDGDVAALDGVFSPAYRRVGLLDSRQLTLPEMKELVLMVRSSFPDLTSEVTTCVADGDRVALLWRSTGTHRGEIGGVPPTGKRVESAGASFYTFEGDQVVEEVETWDPRDLLATLGIRSLRGSDTFTKEGRDARR